MSLSAKAFLIVALLAAGCSTETDAAKRTVCTITVNSPDGSVCEAHRRSVAPKRAPTSFTTLACAASTSASDTSGDTTLYYTFKVVDELGNVFATRIFNARGSVRALAKTLSGSPNR